MTEVDIRLETCLFVLCDKYEGVIKGNPMSDIFRNTIWIMHIRTITLLSHCQSNLNEPASC